MNIFKTLKKVAHSTIVASLLLTSPQINAADWRFGVIRGSDNKQIDIDYQSIRLEAGLVIYDIRLPPEKKLSSLFSSTKYNRETYATSCESQKSKWIASGEENKEGFIEFKFVRPLADAEFVEVPDGSMLSVVQTKICNEIKQTNSKPSSLDFTSKSNLAPNGIVAQEWIAITENEGIKYYAKKQSLERNGDVVTFITGRDLGLDTKSNSGKSFRFEAETSSINCIRNMYASDDSERFDSSGAYIETLLATSSQKTFHAIKSQLGLTYKNLVCAEGNEVSNPSEAKSSFSTGTAWQITKKYLVTAYHVIEGASVISILINDEDVRSASVVTYDEKNDIAILKIDGNPLKTNSISIANTSSKIGSTIAVLGFPLPELLGTKLQANKGEISSLHGLRNDPRLYRITANVQGGNSGGPVLNQRGEAVGIVSSKLNDTETLKTKGELPQSVNFAMKNHYLKSLTESANIITPKTQRKLKPIEDVIEDMRDSVFLVVTETKN